MKPSDPIVVAIEVNALLSGSGKYRFIVRKGTGLLCHIVITKKQYEELKKGFFDKLKDE